MVDLLNAWNSMTLTSQEGLVVLAIVVFLGIRGVVLASRPRETKKSAGNSRGDSTDEK